MAQLGFNAKFIDVVLRCVSTASFSTIINGEAFEFFRSHIGLRQGEPLSPYLFISFTEGLSSLFQVVGVNNSFPGVVVSSDGPKVSNLFFANDSIIFRDAVLNHDAEVRRILNVYKVYSGQNLNLDKCVAIFS